MTWIVAVVLVGTVGGLGLLAWRRLRLLRAGGVHVALRGRKNDDSGRGWQLGVGRYRGDEFAWYRLLSVRPGPDRVIRRDGLEIDARREPTGSETYSMPLGSMVISCHGPDGAVEIAMGVDAMTGFLSWLEASPPGSIIPWAS